MVQRGIAKEVVYMAITFGGDRKGTEGRIVSVIGASEVRQWAQCGINLASALGVHVVWKGECIITVYRSSRLYRGR